MTSTHILLVEDEASIADNVLYALKTEGFETSWVTTGEEAINKIAENSYSLIILDVGLPDKNGFEVCKEIRKTSEIPIIFLTARSDEIDRIIGLEIGGDDYVVKPFSPRELSARVKVILKRSSYPTPSNHDSKDLLSFGPFKIDKHRMKIEYFENQLELSKLEYKLLVILVSRPGRVFSRIQLMNAAWDEPETALERTVDTHIKTIRSKLTAANSKIESAIVTHRGTGYSLREDW